ncbi:MAG: hypothetical protein P8Z73_15135 [Desulfobacteraceae bacterium]|jgi:hypothetical protein
MKGGSGMARYSSAIRFLCYGLSSGNFETWETLSPAYHNPESSRAVGPTELTFLWLFYAASGSGVNANRAFAPVPVLAFMKNNLQKAIDSTSAMINGIQLEHQNCWRICRTSTAVISGSL